MDTSGFSRHGPFTLLYALLPKKTWYLGVVEVVEVWCEISVCLWRKGPILYIRVGLAADPSGGVSSGFGIGAGGMK